MDEQRDSGLGAASEAPAGDGVTTTLIEGGQEPWDGLIATLIEDGDEARGALLDDLAEGRVTASSAQRDRLIELMKSRFAPSSRTAADDGAPIRAWLISALLWIDGEHPDVRDLVLRHLQKRYEPDPSVRLRALQGVWTRGASYRADAAKRAAGDPDRDVAFVAKGMASSPDELSAMLARSLASGTFLQTQRALGVMAIVPQPDLLAQVADLLDTRVEGRRLDGLALRVLAHPATAAAAAAILLERDGAVGLVRRLAVRTRDRPADGKLCARLLAPVPTAEMRKALRSIAADEPALADTARTLDRAAMMLRPEGARGGHYVAGFRSEDLDVANDLLGVGEDVETLTAVMLSRHVDPPLAIGLFGDWGSGKSFFMKSMRRATERLMAEGSPEYCADVVSIEFNAWHYVDGSLMASLVSHLLGALSSYLSPEDTAGKREADLMSGLAGAREVVAGITTAKADAEAELERRRKALEAAQKKRTEGEIRLRDLRLSDLQAVLNESPEARKALEGALNDLGAPAAIGAFTDLRDAVARAHTLEGRVLALARGLVKGPDRRVLIPLIIVLIGAPLALLSLRELIPPTSRAWANLAAWLAEAGALAAAGAHVLKTAGQWVSGRLGDLEAARAKVQKVMDARRGEVAAGEAALAGEVAALKAEEDLMAERLRAATAKVADFEQQVADLRDGRSLTRFLSDRSGSQDYRRHEGVIAVVRRDFEALTQRLADPGAMKDGRRVDRIILYIDDLDRCPEEKVVEVLEAVHLLLAFRLFVVVVAVDSRWLEHALVKAYGAFDARARKPEWRTTPQDYLEKIFQIPIYLRPMSRGGFHRLVEGLLGPREDASAAPRPPPSVAAGDRTGDAPSPDAAPVRDANPGDDQPSPNGDVAETEGPRPPETPRAPAAAPKAAPEPRVAEESLTISPQEIQFAARLHRLFPTPRAAKRFANTWRLLKAGVPLRDLADFEGTQAAPGLFRVPMLLLAMVVGSPAVAEALFPLLEDGRPWKDVLESARDRPRADAAPAPPPEIIAILEETTFPTAPELVLAWLPKVSRFSFTLGRRFAGGGL